jgi:membrane dipeptidase
VGLDTAEKRERYLMARREIERSHPAPRASFDQFMSHVLHALKVVGPDHVGFSGDFDGGGGVEDLMDVTGMPRITERLLAEGYSEVDITKFWSGNVLRVLRAGGGPRDSGVPRRHRRSRLHAPRSGFSGERVRMAGRYQPHWRFNFSCS